MCWKSSGVVRFDLGPLVKDQKRIGKVLSAYNSLKNKMTLPVTS